MRTLKSFRYIGVAVCFFLLMMSVTPSLAQTTRSIELDPEDGKIGDRITVTGVGFNKSTSDIDKYAAIFLSGQEATVFDDIDDEVKSYEIVKEGVWLDEDGDFKTTFTIPEELDDGKDDKDVTSGTYYVYVCHYYTTTLPTIATRIRAVATLTITEGEITISPRLGPVGTLLEVTGNDFPADETLTFKFDNYVLPLEYGNKRTSSGGNFLSVISVPESVAGTHTVTVTASDSKVSEEFTVKPAITMNPTSGEANTKAIIQGTGFGRRTAIEVWFHNFRVATTVTNALGSFSLSFTVPNNLGTGLYAVEAEGENNIAKSKFTIITLPAQPVPEPKPWPSAPEQQAAISISAPSGHIEQVVVVSGVGFKVNDIVVVKYDDETMATTTTDSNGLFVIGIVVPASHYGAHKIAVNDGTNISEVSFTVESMPPPVPTLLVPEGGAKIKAPMSFYWAGVTDDSLPVTYDLQIATRSDFSSESILIDKKQLVKSEYTITSGEQAKLVGGSMPYYWRIRAVDSASNEGNWTYAGVFYVATAFPRWALYTIIVIGGLLLFGLGYLLSMRPRLRRGGADDGS
ncbi:hypothetical protein ACFLXJ_00905 [Chloroflexota bacterium]